MRKTAGIWSGKQWTTWKKKVAEKGLRAVEKKNRKSQWTRQSVEQQEKKRGKKAYVNKYIKLNQI